MMLDGYKKFRIFSLIKIIIFVSLRYVYVCYFFKKIKYCFCFQLLLNNTVNEMGSRNGAGTVDPKL